MVSTDTARTGLPDAIAALRAEGWLGDAPRIPSPNCDARPDGVPIELLVIHNISLPPGVYGRNAIAALFTNSLDANALRFSHRSPICACRRIC